MTATPAAVISGIGEAHPVRRSGRRAYSLIHQAIGDALDDAGIGAGDVDGVVTEALLTPQALPLDQLAPAMGLHAVRYQAQSGPVGAGILLALAHAVEAVKAGLARHVLTYFGVDWGSHGSGPAGIHAAMDAKREVEYPAGFRGPPLYFAAMAHRYAHQYGLDQRELTSLLGGIACSARANAARHEFAQVRSPLPMEEYESQDYLVEPLKRADISLLSDGAIAVVVSDPRAVSSTVEPVHLAGWGHRIEAIADESFYTQNPALPFLPAAERAGQEAAARAGQDLASADVFELYDCFSIATAVQLEALGIVKPGQTMHQVASGGLDIDGSMPTNTHGGLLAHGYLLGGNHLVEAVRQLRHQALGNQVRDAASAVVGAGPGRQYTALVLRRADA